MAADQRRKRLSSASIVGCSSKELYRVKKKNWGLPHNDANLSSHITLEWDGSKKRVVPKREQISLSWRKLRPFVDSVSNGHAILADVVDVPREIFELENLSEVFSLEVWENYLSENERNDLRKFLPGEQEYEAVVGPLFSGDNFHFGNPLVKWEASLCSGALHPDAVFQHDQSLRADKKAYSRELHNYHNNMIGYLQKLKDRFASCKDPEREIIHQMWRSRNIEKGVSSLANESRFEYNATATSESCSWAAEEKACSSDNQTSSVMKGKEFLERVRNKGRMRDRCRTSTNTFDHMLNVGARPEKGEKLQKHDIHSSDGFRYMSYFKISKKQHNLVKNMKQSGSVAQVLGDIGAFNIQPYEVFVEEEKKKLQEHWSQLSKIHLPVAHANWRDVQLQRQQLTKALAQDLNARQTLPMDVDTESHDSLLQDQMDAEEMDQTDTDGMSRESVEKSSSGSQSSQSLEQINGGLQTDHNNLDPGDHDTPNSDDTHLEESEISRNMNPINCSAGLGGGLLSVGNVWPGGISNNYYNSATGHDYASSTNLSLANSHVDEEPKNQGFDVESDMSSRGIGKSFLPRQLDDDTFVESGFHGRDIEKNSLPRQSGDGISVKSDLQGGRIGKNLLPSQPDDGTFLESDFLTGKDLLHRESDDGTFSYENQDKDELLHSLLKKQGVMSYHHKERTSGLDFQPLTSNLIETNGYSGHFQEHPDLSLPLDNIYPDGNRYLIPAQQQLTSAGIQDWAVNSVRMSASHLHSHPINGGSLLGQSQNWFSGEHQIRGGFTDGSTMIPNQSISSRSTMIPNQSISSRSTMDQTLFSVLSHGNQLRSPFHSVGSNGQLVSSRNFGMPREGNPMIGNVLPEVSNPLDYLGGHEIPQGVSWVGIRHQNSNLSDPMEKPYLRSWNQ